MDERSQIAIETVDLTKKYGELTAVNKLNLSISEGEIFGLLGPNGAGKTTTILMLLGLTEPTSGKARVCGHDSTREPLAVKRMVGYLPDNVGFYEDLTAVENMLYTADLNQIPRKVALERIYNLLGRVGLADVADKEVGKFSRGMRQRLGIADVLVKKPKIVILDEPTLGIDPDGVKQMLDIIVQMSKEDKITVLLSSHLLHQVQQICSKVGIFVKGRMVAEGSIEMLGLQILGGDPIVVEAEVAGVDDALIGALKKIPGVSEVEQSAGNLILHCFKDVRGEIARCIVQAGKSMSTLRLRGHVLEEIYLRYFREA
ncbi:MAG TPA: ABC transporter ATP-binding protein [Chloroflexota bacterium]|nr:ABC transporter ATP-binding protein [Chloroflexota bacterium]